MSHKPTGCKSRAFKPLPIVENKKYQRKEKGPGTTGRRRLPGVYTNETREQAIDRILNTQLPADKKKKR